MTTFAEQMADLDRRIPYLEKAAEDLRQQMTQLDKTTHQYLRLSDLLRMGETTIAKLRAQREALARHSRTGKEAHRSST